MLAQTGRVFGNKVTLWTLMYDPFVLGRCVLSQTIGICKLCVTVITLDSLAPVFEVNVILKSSREGCLVVTVITFEARLSGVSRSGICQ